MTKPQRKHTARHPTPDSRASDTQADRLPGDRCVASATTLRPDPSAARATRRHAADDPSASWLTRTYSPHSPESPPGAATSSLASAHSSARPAGRSQRKTSRHSDDFPDPATPTSTTTSCARGPPPRGTTRPASPSGHDPAEARGAAPPPLPAAALASPPLHTTQPAAKRRP